MTDLEWIDSETLHSPRTDLFAVFDERSQTIASTKDRFILVKPRPMVEWYAQRFADRPPKNVFEIGIFKGGSIVLFSELWHPDLLVAVDIESKPVTALEEYIAENDLSGALHPCWGVDQADGETVRKILDEQFKGEPLDIVIDDGCHYLPESRASFNACFPYLAPGGTYVIEDWGWAHWSGTWQVDGGPWADRPAMTMLAIELAMLSASRPDLVASVEIVRELIVVRKGDSTERLPEFDLSAAYFTAGRVFMEQGFPPPEVASPWQAAADATEQVVALRHMLHVVETSRSWRLTAPLRRLRAALRG